MDYLPQHYRLEMPEREGKKDDTIRSVETVRALDEERKGKFNFPPRRMSFQILWPR